jgi:hypothetical protein
VDVLPSPWKYFHTPTFKRLLATSDVLTKLVYQSIFMGHGYWLDWLVVDEVGQVCRQLSLKYI